MNVPIQGEKSKEEIMEVRIQSIHFDATEKLQQFIVWYYYQRVNVFFKI